MSLTQFAMVEELAFLIKDNLPCKHLVLSMEETLLDFLQDDMSSDGVLELEPMNPYSRLLLHRLADIFGFAHQSIGEGEDRHLVLKRCQETSIPSILVGDLLWEHDQYQPSTTSQLLSQGETTLQGRKAERPTTQISLKEREAAYLAARERIFSSVEGETEGYVKEKPRTNPVVARRMIAHALGQRIKQSDQGACPEGFVDREIINSSMGTCREKNKVSTDMVKSHDAVRKVPQNLDAEASTKVSKSDVRKTTVNVSKDSIKEERIGAAKRMFAHALRIHSTKDTIVLKNSEANQIKK